MLAVRMRWLSQEPGNGKFAFREGMGATVQDRAMDEGVDMGTIRRTLLETFHVRCVLVEDVGVGKRSGRFQYRILS
jgi:hypothetical protein